MQDAALAQAQSKLAARRAAAAAKEVEVTEQYQRALALGLPLQALLHQPPAEWLAGMHRRLAAAKAREAEQRLKVGGGRGEEREEGPGLVGVGVRAGRSCVALVRRAGVCVWVVPTAYLAHFPYCSDVPQSN